MRLATVLVLLACACGPTHVIRVVLPETIGDAADVTLAPGVHADHEIVDGCRERHVLFGVRTHGPRHLTLGLGDGWDDEMIALRARAERALGDAAIAVWYGPTCRGGGAVALRIVVASYADVDMAAARVRAFLLAEQRGDEATIEIYRRRSRRRVVELTRYTPYARPPFWPYELALLGGARHDAGWDATYALHLGYIWGRARGRSLDGWFWGAGLDGRVVDRAEGAAWSGGPVLRAGWGFGPLDRGSTWPSDLTNRTTYVYLQAGVAAGDDGFTAAGSIGFTSLAPIQYVALRPWRAWHVLLLPLFVLNHAELEVDQRGRPTFLLGFSL